MPWVKCKHGEREVPMMNLLPVAKLIQPYIGKWSLDAEIVCSILSYLPLKDYYQFSHVNHTLHEAVIESLSGVMCQICQSFFYPVYVIGASVLNPSQKWHPDLLWKHLKLSDAKEIVIHFQPKKKKDKGLAVRNLIFVDGEQHVVIRSGKWKRQKPPASIHISLNSKTINDKNMKPFIHRNSRYKSYKNFYVKKIIDITEFVNSYFMIVELYKGYIEKSPLTFKQIFIKEGIAYLSSYRPYSPEEEIKQIVVDIQSKTRKLYLLACDGYLPEQLEEERNLYEDLVKCIFEHLSWTRDEVNEYLQSKSLLSLYETFNDEMFWKRLERIKRETLDMYFEILPETPYTRSVMREKFNSELKRNKCLTLEEVQAYADFWISRLMEYL
jgi:hypothetical protein